MDLGAMVCRPRNPDCAACPLSADCAAALAGEAGILSAPRRRQGAAGPLRRRLFRRRRDGAFLARRRPPKGLLGATLELPGPPWRTAEDGGANEARPFAARWRRLPGEVEQVFTHFALRLTVYVADDRGHAAATPAISSGSRQGSEQRRLFQRHAEGDRPRAARRLVDARGERVRRASAVREPSVDGKERVRRPRLQVRRVVAQ